MDEATSSPSAPMTEATATIAELPQIELPHATRIAKRFDRPSSLPIVKLRTIVPVTITTMQASRRHPAASTVAALTLAPRSTTATSRSCLALNLMPGIHAFPGVQAVRTAVPIRIDSTSASIHGLSLIHI